MGSSNWAANPAYQPRAETDAERYITHVRGRLLGIEIECGHCIHWSESTDRWCHRYQHLEQPPNIRATVKDNGDVYCDDFETP